MAAPKEARPLSLFPSEGPGHLSKEATTALYAVLRDLARRQLRKSNGATLNTTALAHEAWIKLAGSAANEFKNRAHFLAVAAIAMRQVLVDHGRRRHAQRRGGAARVTSSGLSSVGSDSSIDELLAIDAALNKLATIDLRLVRVIELRIFGGLEEEEIAAALDVNVRTVRRDLRKARAFILSEIVAG
jgi:RNA polymerase sigma factor (TIGR02999 family)